MQWSARVSSLVMSAALLAPLTVPAESRRQSADTQRVTASAHVDFKIVIPTVLSLAVLGDGGPVSSNRNVAIGSNGRTVVMAATLKAVDAPRHDVIIRAAAGKTIAQDRTCTLGAQHAGAAAQDPRMICTVSMP